MKSFVEFINENICNSLKNVINEGKSFNICFDDKELDKKAFIERINPHNDPKISNTINELFDIIYSFNGKAYEIPFRYSDDGVKLNRTYQNNKTFREKLKNINGISNISEKGFKIGKKTIMWGRGSISGQNQGNAFETYFLENWPNFLPKIKEVLNIKNDMDEIKANINPEHDGTLNTRRTDIDLLKPNGAKNIGKIVTDITLKSLVYGNIYLSLKYKNRIAVANMGIKKYFTKDYFENNKENKEADELLKTFGIDKIKFIDTFTKYQKTEKRINSEYYSDEIKDEKIIDYYQKLLESAVGYGYLLVWAPTSNFDDLIIKNITEEYMKKAIGEIKSIEIKYPKNFDAKNVNIKINNTGQYKFELKFRSKDGKQYPNSIVFDYTPTKE